MDIGMYRKLKRSAHEILINSISSELFSVNMWTPDNVSNINLIM